MSTLKHCLLHSTVSREHDHRACSSVSSVSPSSFLKSEDGECLVSIRVVFPGAFQQVRHQLWYEGSKDR